MVLKIERNQDILYCTCMCVQDVDSVDHLPSWQCGADIYYTVTSQHRSALPLLLRTSLCSREELIQQRG